MDTIKGIISVRTVNEQRISRVRNATPRGMRCLHAAQRTCHWQTCQSIAAVCRSSYDTFRMYQNVTLSSTCSYLIGHLFHPNAVANFVSSDAAINWFAMSCKASVLDSRWWSTKRSARINKRLAQKNELQLQPISALALRDFLSKPIPLLYQSHNCAAIPSINSDVIARDIRCFIIQILLVSVLMLLKT